MTKTDDDDGSCWRIQQKKGKPIKLRGNKKRQEFQCPIERIGKHILVFHLADHVPSGPRYVEVLVQVFSQVPANEEIVSKDIDCKALEEVHTAYLTYENVYHSEVFRLSKDEPTVAARWHINDADLLPARVRVIAMSHHPVIGMKFAARMYIDPDWNSEVDNIPKSFIPSSTFIYQVQELDVVKSQLDRKTSERKEAFSKGMIRPFLLLVSMHPYVRHQIGELLGIDLDDNTRGDPHAEAQLLLSKRRKGLSFIADHTWETMNPLSDPSNWYHCLYRGVTEVKKRRHLKLKKLSHHESIPLCKDAEDSVIPELEIQILKNARSFHRTVLKKTDKKLAAKVKSFMEDPDILQLFETMEKGGIHDAKIHRFVIEICVLVHFNNWAVANKKRGWVTEKKAEIYDKVHEKIGHKDEEVLFTQDETQLAALSKQERQKNQEMLELARASSSDSNTSEKDGSKVERSRSHSGSRMSSRGDDDSESDSEGSFSEDSRYDKEWHTKEIHDEDDQEEQAATEWADEAAYSFTSAQLIKGLHNQLRKGSYVPSGFTKNSKVGQVGTKVGVTGGKKGIKEGAKYMTGHPERAAGVTAIVPLAPLAPLVPFMFLPLTVANIMSKIAGSNHATLWIVTVQIVLQRVLLAVHGVNVSDYYKDLTDEYVEDNKNGKIGHFEHKHWKKIQKSRAKNVSDSSGDESDDHSETHNDSEKDGEKTEKKRRLFRRKKSKHGNDSGDDYDDNGTDSDSSRGVVGGSRVDSNAKGEKHIEKESGKHDNNHECERDTDKSDKKEKKHSSSSHEHNSSHDEDKSGKKVKKHSSEEKDSDKHREGISDKVQKRNDKVDHHHAHDKSAKKHSDGDKEFEKHTRNIHHKDKSNDKKEKNHDDNVDHHEHEKFAKSKKSKETSPEKRSKKHDSHHSTDDKISKKDRHTEDHRELKKHSGSESEKKAKESKKSEHHNEHDNKQELEAPSTKHKAAENPTPFAMLGFRKI